MTNENATNETVETGNAITVSADQISVHPDLATTLDEVVLNELTQHSLTHNVVSCISNTVVFPVVPKKGARKNKHYHLIGLTPYFHMMERKGHKEFRVAVVDEPSILDLKIGNAYQLTVARRGQIEDAILAAVLELANSSLEAKQAKMNFVECETGNGKFDPMETVAGFKRGARIIKALKGAGLSAPVVAVLKILKIDFEEDGDQHESEPQAQDG